MDGSWTPTPKPAAPAPTSDGSFANSSFANAMQNRPPSAGPGGPPSGAPTDFNGMMGNIYNRIQSYDPTAAINSAWDQTGNLMQQAAQREWGGNMSNHGLPPSAGAAQNAFGLAMAPVAQQIAAGRAQDLSNAGHQSITDLSGLLGSQAGYQQSQAQNQLAAASLQQTAQQAAATNQLAQAQLGATSSYNMGQLANQQQQTSLQAQQQAAQQQQAQAGLLIQQQDAQRQQALFTQQQQIAHQQQALAPGQYYNIPNLPGGANYPLVGPGGVGAIRPPSQGASPGASTPTGYGSGGYGAGTAAPVGGAGAGYPSGDPGSYTFAQQLAMNAGPGMPGYVSPMSPSNVMTTPSSAPIGPGNSLSGPVTTALAQYAGQFGY